MKGKAGRVYSLTPKGDAAMKAVKAYIETLDTEMKKLDDPNKNSLVCPLSQLTNTKLTDRNTDNGGDKNE